MICKHGNVYGIDRTACGDAVCCKEIQIGVRRDSIKQQES